LTGANLTGANLGTATLTGVASGGIVGTPASLPPGWILVNGFLIKGAVNLSNADLHGLDLSNAYLAGANLTNANLTGTNLTNADLTGANLTNAQLGNANLTNTSLSGATLTGARSGAIVGTPASLPSPWVLRGGFLLGPGASLANATLTGVNL